MTWRIALTGAQGTGKTTLARAIANGCREAGLDDVGLHVGLGDSVAQRGRRVGANATADTILLFARLHEARVGVATGQVQIFDRSLLDCLAYAHVLGALTDADLRALVAATKADCAHVDRQLWLRVTVDYPVQSADDETPEFRRAIDEATGRLARAHSLPLVEHAIPPERVDDIATAACHEALVTIRSRPERAAQPRPPTAE